MNRTLKFAALAAAFVVPALSFAQQSNKPLTRAQVREEASQLVKAGYRIGGRDNRYPEDLWAAQARVAAGHEGANQP